MLENKLRQVDPGVCIESLGDPNLEVLAFPPEKQSLKFLRKTILH
jgi:hypothetical protein